MARFTRIFFRHTYVTYFFLKNKNLFEVMGITGTFGNSMVCLVIARFLSTLTNYQETQKLYHYYNFVHSQFVITYLCKLQKYEKNEFRTKSMRTSTNFFLFSLAVADIAILLMGSLSHPKFIQQVEYLHIREKHLYPS